MSDANWHVRKKKKYPKGRCQGCGAKLTSPVSLDRGYGSKCWMTKRTIILDIRESGKIVVTSQPA